MRLSAAALIFVVTLIPTVCAGGSAPRDLLAEVRRDWHCDAFFCTFPGLTYKAPVDRRFEPKESK